MAILFKKRGLGDTNAELIPSRRLTRSGSVNVDPDTALRSSVVWAALTARANMISTTPIDVFRKVSGIQVEVPKPNVLVNTGGQRVGIQEFLHNTQFDLDRVGNTYGIISEVDAAGMPARIDLVDHRTVTVRVNRESGAVTYQIGSKFYLEDEIWHERQYTVSGFVMGLSPVTYAAWSIGQNQSALDFGLEWFANGGSVPSGHLKNVAKQLAADEAETIKRRFKSAISGRDVFVTGNDWTYETVLTESNNSQFLETQQASESQIVRYFGMPGDIIGVASNNKSAITYASVSQRFLELLIIHLGPVFARREAALSKLVAEPRFVKFATDSILRMDPEARARMFALQISSKQRVPSELRQLDNLAPFTPAQLQELEDLNIVSTAPLGGAA